MNLKKIIEDIVVKRYKDSIIAEYKEEQEQLKKQKEKEENNEIILIIVRKLEEMKLKEKLEKRKKELTKKLGIINDIMLKSQENQEILDFLKSYNNIYFPLLNVSLSKIIANAKLNKTKLSSKEEKRVLKKLFITYIEIADYIIKYNSDNSIESVDVCLNAVVNHAKMNGYMSSEI